jgi:hypothetical protein
MREIEPDAAALGSQELSCQGITPGKELAEELNRFNGTNEYLLGNIPACGLLFHSPPVYLR